MARPRRLIIQCEHASEPVQQLGEDESYRLQITPQAGAYCRHRIRWACCAGWKHFGSLLFHAARFGSAGRRHSRPSAIPVARVASGRLAALDAHRSGEAQSRRHGGGEAKRLPLASVGRPGLSRGEQAFSEAAAARIRWALLHAGAGSRGDRVREGSRDSRSA